MDVYPRISSNTNYNVNPFICNTVMKVEELIKQLQDFAPSDVVVIQSTDPETGDECDLHTFHVDCIGGVQTTYGTINEIRLVQEHVNNSLS